MSAKREETYGRSYFEKRYSAILGKPYETTAPQTELILNMLKPQQGEHIVDAGTGIGHHAWLMSEAGAIVSAFDVSESAIQTARELYETRPEHLVFQVRDCVNEALPANSYDAALVSHVIEHLDSAESLRLWQNVYRSLKIHGRVVCVCPVNEFTLYARILNRLLRLLGQEAFDPTHIRNMTLTIVKGELEKVAFAVVSHTYVLMTGSMRFITWIPGISRFLASSVVVKAEKI